MQNVNNVNNVLYFFLLMFIFTIAISKTINLIFFILLYMVFLVQFKNTIKHSFKKILKDKVFLSFLLFLTVSLIGITYSENKIEGLKRTKLLINFPLIYFLFFTFKLRFSIDEYRNFLKKLIEIFIWGIFFLDAGGFLEFFILHKNVLIPFRPLGLNHLWAGNVNALAFLICFVEFYFERKKILTIPLFIFLISMFLTGARTGWMGFSISWLLLGFLISRFKKSAFTFISFLVFLGVTFMFMYKIGFVKERFHLVASEIKEYGKGIKGTSIGLRFEMWKASYYIIKKHFLFGAGTGDYQLEVKKLAKEKKVFPGIVRFNHPHNTYLFIWDTLGLAGLIIFFVFCAKIIKIGFKMLKKYPKESLILLTVTTEILVGSLTENLVYIHIIFIIFSFVISACILPEKVENV